MSFFRTINNILCYIHRQYSFKKYYGYFYDYKVKDSNEKKTYMLNMVKNKPLLYNLTKDYSFTSNDVLSYVVNGEGPKTIRNYWRLNLRTDAANGIYPLATKEKASTIEYNIKFRDGQQVTAVIFKEKKESFESFLNCKKNEETITDEAYRNNWGLSLEGVKEEHENVEGLDGGSDYTNHQICDTTDIFRVEDDSDGSVNTRGKRTISKTPIIIVGCICALVALSFVAIKVVAPSIKYGKAVKLMESGNYDYAISAFEQLDGYKDSADQILNCQYEKALALESDGQYDSAIEILEYLNGYRDSSEQLVICKYNKAVSLMTMEEYEEALDILSSIDYNDSVSLAEECVSKSKMTSLKSATIGDVITFGSYEQDNNTSNGSEAIEWIVLDKSDNNILVISKYILDIKKYNSTGVGVTWETSSLREWLNSTFMNVAFTNFEQNYILSFDLTTNDTRSGDVYTKDKVFVLSSDECEKYGMNTMFSSTSYVDSMSSSSGLSGWWLRNTTFWHEDDVENSACQVSNYYGIRIIPGQVDLLDGVRPALWIVLG